MNKVMCIVPANLEELERKGVTSHILQRDLGGYWGAVHTVHPFCKYEQYKMLKKGHYIHEYRTKNIFKTIYKLVKLVKKEKIEVIKAHDPYFCGLVALIVSIICRIPYVVMICSSYDIMNKYAGMPNNGLVKSRIVDNIMDSIILRKASMVFGGSGDAGEFAIRRGAARYKMHIIRTGGINEKHFEPVFKRVKVKHNYEKRKRKIIMYVGRMSIEKFPFDVIDAFKAIHSYFDNTVLYMVGDGPLKKELMEYAPNNVRFTGFVGQDKLIELMNIADVVLATLCGSSLVECCLAERAIVAYDVDWHREIIVNYQTGVLVPFRDYKAMAYETIELLKDDKLRQVMGKRARTKAIRQHSLDVLYKKESECFDNLLGRVG